MARAELAEILSAMRARGGRVTNSRRAIVQAILESDPHVTAEDLVAQVQAELPALSRSTVYRTLEALEELGVVEHVHLGHGPAVYHLAENSHHHLVCDRCGAVVEAPPSLFAGMARKVRTAYGFRLRPHFALVGRCAGCVDEAEAPT